MNHDEFLIEMAKQASRNVSITAAAITKELAPFGVDVTPQTQTKGE